MVSDFRDAVSDLAGPGLELLWDHRAGRKVTRSLRRAHFEQDLRARARARGRSRLAHLPPAHVAKKLSKSHSEIQIAFGQYLAICDPSNNWHIPAIAGTKII